MSAFKRIIALSAAALAVCFALSSCSAQKEDNGVKARLWRCSFVPPRTNILSPTG